MEPFDVRHYLSKTLQLQFVLKTLYKEYRIGLLMVPLNYLSLTCRSVPHRKAYKKGRNSHPGTFHRLFRLIISQAAQTHVVREGCNVIYII